MLELQVAVASELGLVNNALWCPATAKRLTLTPGSIFLEKRSETEADVFAAVAAALQVRRTEGEERLGIRYPCAIVLRSDNYMGQARFESVLRACILRAARADELRRWQDSDEIQQSMEITRLLRGENVATEELEPLQLETLVALMCRKLSKPRLDDADRRNLMRLNYGKLICLVSEEP